MTEPLLIAKSKTQEIHLLPQLANRHGLIAGATGTGKTVTLKVLAESFSRIGVPVFLADAKGDLSAVAGFAFAREGDTLPANAVNQYDSLNKSITQQLKSRISAIQGLPSAITDNLEALHMDDENTHGSVDYILQKVPLQFKSLNYIRGRSFQQSLILIDECQNLTPHQMKTIITRAARGPKWCAWATWRRLIRLTCRPPVRA